jgi:hypothetical protein
VEAVNHADIQGGRFHQGNLFLQFARQPFVIVIQEGYEAPLSGSNASIPRRRSAAIGLMAQVD